MRLIANHFGVSRYHYSSSASFARCNSFLGGQRERTAIAAALNRLNSAAPDSPMRRPVAVDRGPASEMRTLTQGPRLQTGLGPVATTLADVNHDGRLDLLVSNSQSNDVYVLPGVGGGFFNDTPQARQVHRRPGPCGPGASPTYTAASGPQHGPVCASPRTAAVT